MKQQTWYKMGIASLIGLTCGIGHATEVFSDNFEPGANPYGGTTLDVSTYTLANTSGQYNTELWVKASDGYKASYSGLVDETENSGANFTDPTGTQALGFRYSNTGATTKSNIIGRLATGMKYTVTFDVVKDGFNAGIAYEAALVLFNDGAVRTSVTGIGNNTAAILAKATGNANTDGTYTTVSFSYTVGDPVVDNNGAGAGTATTWLESLLGKDVALRFDGATSYANIDNVKIEVVMVGAFYWDMNGATEGAGGTTPSGTWDATSTRWNDNPGGMNDPAAWTPETTAVFSSGTDATGFYTVTVDGIQDIAGLYFEDGTVTLTGGTALRLTTDAFVTVVADKTATITTVLSEDTASRKLTKEGAGTLVLSGENTYSGTTTVNAGTLTLTSGTCLPDATNLTIKAGAKLQLNDGVKEKVGSLTLGTTPKTDGTYGSTSSKADNKDDTYFSGPGVLYVNVDIPPSSTLIIIF